jgi:hypothetical protein
VSVAAQQIPLSRVIAALSFALDLTEGELPGHAARTCKIGTAKRTSKRVDWSGRLPAFVWSLRTVAPGGSLRARAGRLMAIKEEGEVTGALMAARCDRGAQIARMLGFPDRTAEAIRALDEHWDGGGQPRGLHGEEVPLLGRILCLAQTAEIFHAAGGVDAALAVVRRRAGRWFDPALARAFGGICSDAAFAALELSLGGGARAAAPARA